MNNELERVRKEAVVAWFRMVSWHLSGGTDESNENPVRIAKSSDRDLNPGATQY
jgi:hypothetical protein